MSKYVYFCLMRASELQILLDKVYRPISKIEEDLGMPKTTLQKAVKGLRSLPKRWSVELKEYVKTGGWISANVKENNKSISSVTVSDEYGQMGNSGEINRDTWKHTNIKIAANPPKSLDELKALCPKELTGFDKSNWIRTERQKYGI